MLGTGIKQTTATTGTGALTTTAVSGMPMLSDVFALNVPISYTLLDSAGLFIEAGIGYLSASTTFVRAIVSATFVAGVYNNVNPTAASLSGTTTIICTPHAATMESMLPTVDNQSASVNRFLTSAARNHSTAIAGPSTAQAVYVPFLLRTGAAIVSLSINVTTLVAAATGKAGIYACNEKGYPGAKLVETPSTFDMSATGLKTQTLSAPIFLPPGWYYTAYIGDTGSSRVTGYSSNVANIIGGHPMGFNTSLGGIDYRTEFPGTFNLPATANSTTSAQAIGGGAGPIVYLGV